jgi:hypothetical protein
MCTEEHMLPHYATAARRECLRWIVSAVFLLMATPFAAGADCATECSAAYRSCQGNPDSCLSQQGVCLSRCGLEHERHGAIAYSVDKGAYGSAWGMSQHEAAAKALGECRPHGGKSCQIKRQVCSGAGR